MSFKKPGELLLQRNYKNLWKGGYTNYLLSSSTKLHNVFSCYLCYNKYLHLFPILLAKFDCVIVTLQ